MQKRRVVLDNSVVLPMFFKEEMKVAGDTFKASRRAAPILTAIACGRVIGFAPSILMFEFVKCAMRKALGPEITKRQIAEFRGLPLVYTEMNDLFEDALRMVEDYKVPSTDAWYAACAKQRDAELWILSPPKDKFVTAAAKALPNKVFTLWECEFSKPKPTKF